MFKINWGSWHEISLTFVIYALAVLILPGVVILVIGFIATWLICLLISWAIIPWFRDKFDD